MTNLEWIRTLSAKELSDLLYDYWLPRGQYVWTDSRKGLVKMLGETYLERDCDKCKHQGNCYCVKGLGCPFDPKTKPSNSEKPNICEVKNYCDDCLYTDTCDSKEFFYACTSKATISKMEQVEDEFKQFDREDLILLIECQKERIAELLADKDTPQTDSEITRNSLRTDCTGCKFVGWYDTDFPCVNCIRKNKDYYTSEQTEREGEE